MFETMQGFLFFFIPMCVAILLGILFEEKLIAFEQHLKARISAKRRKSASTRRAPQLSKVQKTGASRRKTVRKDAA